MQAYRCILNVDEKGKLESIEVPELSKSSVEVISEDESPVCLLAASQSSTDFWENETDDQVWNNA